MPVLQIHGFIVVRKPDQNYDPLGCLGYPKSPPAVANTFYGGVDRMRWFDIDEDYCNKTLPEEMNDLRNQLRKDNIDLCGIDVAKSFDVASQLLTYSNKNGLQNEMIAIYSEKLSDYKGVFHHNTAVSEYLGYDVMALGEWSLIEGGIFTAPDVFPEWIVKLNENGLFSNPGDAEEYANAYIDAMKIEVVEPIQTPTHDTIIPIKVYKVT